MLQTSWPYKEFFRNGSELDFGTGNATKCTFDVRAPTAFQSSTIEAKGDSDGIDMFCLPVLWSLGSKTDELRQWSKSISADVPGPLKSVIEYALRDQSDSNHVVKKCAVHQSYGQFTVDFTEDQHFDKFLEKPVLSSAIHDLGIPKLCTDIVHLLIDDLLHISEEKTERYYRVWCRSGSATLVSSTTVRNFNATRNLAKVSFQL